MDTRKKPLFVAFSSQKGGVGKSTFTTLVASTMHYRLGYNVAVFDADFPQHSLMKMKTRDLAMVMENEALKKLAYKQFTKGFTVLYDVVILTDYAQYGIVIGTYVGEIVGHFQFVTAYLYAVCGFDNTRTFGNQLGFYDFVI